MTTPLARAEAELSSIRELSDQAIERRFIRVVDRLARSRSDGALGVLLARIEDREHDIQDYLLHAIDTFPRKIHATALARELVPLHRRAPYRTRILLIGVVQSPPDARALANALVGAGPEIRTVVCEVLALVAAERPDLKHRVDQLVKWIIERREPT